jgi:16S rRNA (cytosine967-C5)-methyltransferase
VTARTAQVSPARAIATRVLERVARDAAFADLALGAELSRQPLAMRDAALTTELVYGTLRWQRYLDWILAPHSRRRLDSLDTRVLVLLRMTAYQIAFLERIPAFAAVDDAVTLARGRRPGAAEFTNGVLRSFARRGPREREPAPPSDPLEALAVRSSFPTWLVARWVARWGSEETVALMRALNERPPLTLRTNTLRLTREDLAERLKREEGLTPTPTPRAIEGIAVDHAGAPDRWRAFVEGALAVQDEGSMLVARLLAPGPGQTVADVCAAPGTKTTHLAQLMDNDGRIIALDPQPSRLARVVEAATRLGVTIVELHDGTAEKLAPTFADACDGVLVDAPCSNLGVLRRNPEVKWRRTPDDVVAGATRQRAILAAAATMVKPGGRLVYATCSLEPEENEAVVRALLDARPDFRLDPPAEFPVTPDADGFIRCLPHRHGTDGFTAARLARVEGPGARGV